MDYLSMVERTEQLNSGQLQLESFGKNQSSTATTLERGPVSTR